MPHRIDNNPQKLARTDVEAKSEEYKDKYVIKVNESKFLRIIIKITPSEEKLLRLFHADY